MSKPTFGSIANRDLNSTLQGVRLENAGLKIIAEIANAGRRKDSSCKAGKIEEKHKLCGEEGHKARQYQRQAE